MLGSLGMYISSAVKLQADLVKLLLASCTPSANPKTPETQRAWHSQPCPCEPPYTCFPAPTTSMQQQSRLLLQVAIPQLWTRVA